jgi:Trk K+ transport system NAD-binding subunit
MILNGNYLYKIFSPLLGIFERSKIKEARIDIGDKKDHIVLIGANRIGEGILESLQKQKEDFLVVEFDPDIADALKEKGVISVFGDIADPEIQERAYVSTAKLIISTVTDVEDNLLLLRSIKKEKSPPKVLVVAYENDEAKLLYEEGADYVILPHVAGGHHISKILVEKNHLEILEKYKKRDLDILEK